MLSVLVLIGWVVQCTVAAPPRDLMTPKLEFDMYNIKTPQLIGIIAGCCVFFITISVVLYLLIASGTLQRALVEIAQDGGKVGSVARPLGSVDMQDKSKFISPYHEQPELYDHLLLARSSLPVTVSIVEPLPQGQKVSIRSYRSSTDASMVFEASNGSAQFHESAYDPGRIWGWCDLDARTKVIEKDSGGDESSEVSYSNKDLHPWESMEEMQEYFDYIQQEKQYSLFVIVDKEFVGKVIGMIFLSRNEPANLSINLEYVWITPAFQGSKKVHEAILLLLLFLFEKGYRRITCMVDERHIVGRKFLMRCGFMYEGTLRKHRIIRSRNCNTALYSLVNSDWVDCEGKMKKFCSWKITSTSS